jgi:2-polyprenyl-3-methyl-5-hydroxy-6-metoxy-1,4-benzoquinol methylase
MSSSVEEKARQDQIPWERGKFFKAYELMLVDYLVRSVLENAKGSSLLDIACGNGLVTSQLAPHFRRVVGLDASAAHLEKALRDYPHIEFIEGLAENYQTRLNLLEHVEDPVALLSGTKRLLDQSGVLIVNVPNAMAVNRRIAVLMGTLESEYELSPYDLNVAGHRRYYDMQSLERDVVAAGLRPLKRGGVFYKALSQAQLNWMLETGPWEAGGFGWGRVGSEHAKDWRKAFCDACYEFGKQRPDDCNLLYIVAQI